MPRQRRDFSFRETRRKPTSKPAGRPKASRARPLATLLRIQSLEDRRLLTGSIPAVGTPPTITAPAAVSDAEGTNISFKGPYGISLADPAATSGTTEEFGVSVTQGTLSISDTSGITFVNPTMNGQAGFIISGTLTAINNALATLVDVPTGTYTGGAALNLSDLNMTDNDSVSTTVPITITSPQPTIIAPGTVTVTENSTNFPLANQYGISVADATGTQDSMTLTLGNVNSSLKVANNSGLSSIMGNQTSTLTLTGSLSGLNTALGTLSYTPAPNTNGSDTLTLTDKDPVSNLSATTTVVAITVNPPPPTVNAPQSVSVTEDSSLTFNGANAITVTDLGAGPETFILSVSDGILDLTNTTGLSPVNGNGTSSITVTGSLYNLNNDLASLTYAPTTGFAGDDFLNLSDEDQADSETGTTVSVPITVNPLPPQFTGPSSVSVSENTSFAFSGADAISVADSGGNNEELTLSVPMDTGSLSLTTTGLSSPVGNGTDLVTFGGTVAKVNAALATLKYLPATDFTGNISLTLSDNDPSDGKTGSLQVLLGVGESLPTITAPTSVTVDGNSSFAFTGANAVSLADADATVSTTEYMQLRVASGTLSLTTTGLPFFNGSGTDDVQIEGTLSQLNNALATLSYTPTTGYSGGDILNLDAHDFSSGLEGSASTSITVTLPYPSVTAPASVNAYENMTLAFTGQNAITVTDPGG